MPIVSCSFDRHAEAILAILNEAIATSTARCAYAPRPAASMRTWFAAKADGAFPLIGHKFGAWRDLACYQVILDTPAQPVEG